MKYFLIKIVLLVIILISGFYLWQFYQKKELPSRPAVRKIHYYNDETRSLEKLSLKVFYFVPQDKKLGWNYKEVLDETLKEIKAFHYLQFQGLSELNYEIYPEPVIGLNSTEFYDGPDTSAGNPRALETVTEELEKIFSRDDSIFVIVYEGVGASGSSELKSSIIASGYFIQELEKTFAPSVFYHEFAHTLGIPDAYDHAKNIPFSNDIMGAGRNKPLKITYLSQEVKEKMGF